MSAGMMLLFVGGFLLLIGFLETLPWSVKPSAPRPERRWYDDVSGAEPVGYLMMLGGGFVVAVGVVALLADGLAEPGDPPLGALLMGVGAAGMWCWLYDHLYQRLRRPQPTSRWAGLIGALGKVGKRLGPAALVVGVVVTIAL